MSHNSLTTLHGELSGLPCLRVSVPLLPQGLPGTSGISGHTRIIPEHPLSRQLHSCLSPLCRQLWLVQTA